MKALPSVLYVSFIVFQVLPHPSSTLWNLSRFFRSEGDIEIGPDPTFQCPLNTPVAPHPDKCELYYTCYPGYPVTLWQCYSNYLFDLRYSGCNFSYDTDCGDRQRPSTSTHSMTTSMTTTTPITTLSPPFFCPENGYYPVSECSSQYYLCVSGDFYPQVCPNDSVFDPQLLYCVPPDQLPACSTTTNETPTQSSSPSSPIPIDCEADGFYAFEPCLSVYYACINGVPYYQECPNGWIFVEGESKCKRPEETDCFDSTTQTKPETTPSTVMTTINNCDVTTVTPYEFTCPDEETNFYPIYPGACSEKYYTCYTGVAYPQKCPEGFIFVATMGACASVEIAGCTPCPNIV